MIDGLKLTMSGEEIIALLDERIERIRQIIGIKRDAIEGKGPPSRAAFVWQVPAETVEDEILRHEHRIRVLTIVRDHIVRGETYLIGRNDIEFGELLPDQPVAEPDINPEKGIRWVDHPVDVSFALRRPWCPGD